MITGKSIEEVIKDMKTDAYTHWTILFDNKFHDPEFEMIEGKYPYGKITSFLGIYL